MKKCNNKLSNSKTWMCKTASEIKEECNLILTQMEMLQLDLEQASRLEIVLQLSSRMLLQKAV